MGAPSAFKELQLERSVKTNPYRRQVWNRGFRHGWWLARSVVLALLTPLLEKNPHKTRVSRCHVPVVLSMARLVVLLFAAAMLRQIYLAGIAGWPEATVCIAVVLAIPLLAALEHFSPEQAMQLMQSLVQKMGDGALRGVGSIYPAVTLKAERRQSDGDDADRRLRAA